MRIRVGTSGFGYPEWRGKFFPKKFPATKMLGYYAERFDTTEINSTFYRMPRKAVLEAWSRQTPKDFRFSFKAPGLITHRKRLKNCARDVEKFLSVVPAVGHKKLGVIVFQLPPNFQLDLQRLKAFLLLLPKPFRYAFEFRHPSWFTPEVYAILKKAKIAMALNDADVEGCPLTCLAPFGVLKLRRTEYSDLELRALAAKVKAQDWKDAFVFFKHEEKATGPKLANRFKSF